MLRLTCWLRITDAVTFTCFVDAVLACVCVPCSLMWWHMGGMCWGAEYKAAAGVSQAPVWPPQSWLVPFACWQAWCLLLTGEPSPCCCCCNCPAAAEGQRHCAKQRGSSLFARLCTCLGGLVGIVLLLALLSMPIKQV